MKRNFTGFAVTFCGAFVAFSSPVRAQIKEWNPSCAQVLTLGYYGYVKEYGKRTNDYSTAGMMRSAQRYQDCKDAANAKRLPALPAMRRMRVQKVQSEWKSWKTRCGR